MAFTLHSFLFILHFCRPDLRQMQDVNTKQKSYIQRIPESAGTNHGLYCLTNKRTAAKQDYKQSRPRILLESKAGACFLFLQRTEHKTYLPLCYL